MWKNCGLSEALMSKLDEVYHKTNQTSAILAQLVCMDTMTKQKLLSFCLKSNIAFVQLYAVCHSECDQTTREEAGNV